MIKITVAELAAAIGAEFTGDPAAGSQIISDVVIDSRLAASGSLFVSLPGEHVDGEAFVSQVFERGAVAALTTQPVADHPCLVAEDRLTALGLIGQEVVRRGRDHQGLRVIGITGSQGKTSTKDLLSQVLEAAAETIAPVGSFNNEIGVPLTATRITESTRYLVSEMGARGIGHIDYLCELTPPQVGLVLNVGHAHMGEFGSREAIAQAKSELVRALPAEGIAVLNADDRRVAAMAEVTKARVLRFSCETDLDVEVWASGIKSDDLSRHRFALHYGAEVAEVDLQVIGRHQVSNAVAAAAAALALGLPLSQIASALSAATTRSAWRMELHTAPGEVAVLNDAYNANPDSMAAALRTLAEIGERRRHSYPSARTWAVLGEMLELGETAQAEHRAIGDLAGHLGISRIIAIGENAKAIHEGAVQAGLSGEESVLVDDKAAALAKLTAQLAPGDVVLVKASRGVALETLAAALLDTTLEVTAL